MTRVTEAIPCDSSTDPGMVAALTDRGAASTPHPGGTLLAHLQRTARNLESWGAGRALAIAGLCHAAYGTQGFPTALFTLEERDALRERIGDEAEAIVYAYCALDRTHAQASGRARGLEIRDRFSGEYWTPSARMRRRLAELTAANELDVVQHAKLSDAQLRAVGEMLEAVGGELSPAAWSALTSEPKLQAGLAHAAAASGNARMESRTPLQTAPESALRTARVADGDVELSFRDLGACGPRVVLWHGGAGPELTWARQHALAATLQLRIPWRRGFAPSAHADRQDWECDVRDLLRVLPHRAHVVAHSYGGVSAVVAASVAPERFASLVVIEAPLWSCAPEDTEVQQLAALGRAFARGAPEARAAFFALAALPGAHGQSARIERLARDFRDPGEAKPDLERVRSNGLRVAVVSGTHNAAIERLSDAIARDVGAERWVLPGAGHALQRQKEFNAKLEAWIAASA